MNIELEKPNNSKKVFSILLMILAICLINLYFLAPTPWKYIGLPGFFMVGFFWNNKVV